MALPSPPTGVHARSRHGDSDHEPLVSLRGVALVAVAVALGAFLLPSGSRAPRASSAATVASATPAATPAGTSAVGGGTLGTGAGGSGSSAAAPTASTGSTGAASPKGSSSSGATTGLAPASVHVLVANASSVNGLAASVGAGLQAKGYAITGEVSALAAVATSQVYPLDATGTAAETGILAALGLAAGDVVTAQGGPPPVSSTAGADIVVVAGPDLGSRFPPASSGG